MSMVMLTGYTNEVSSRLDVGDVFGGVPEGVEGQNWAGIYLNDEKIGYSYESYQNSGRGIIYKEYMLMRIPLGGAVREVAADNFGLLDSALSVKSFSAGMTSGEYDITIHGSVNKGNLELSYISGGGMNSRNIALNGPLYFQGQVSRLVKVSGFKPGKFSLPIFDPLAMNVTQLEVTVRDSSASGVDSLHELELEVSGIKTVMTVDNDGNVLKEEQPGGMMLRSQPREEALVLKNVYSSGEDFLVKLSVPSSSIIEDCRNITYFKAELKGIDPHAFSLSDSCTQLLVSNDPVILEINRQNTRQINVSDLGEYLASSTFIQSDDQAIKELAGRITHGINLNRERAFALSDWVFKNITKDITVSVPSAVEVLRVRRGDCNEHTALYTALARAAGIPCKTVVGIVYKDGMFFYHAWPAVFLGYWHQLDPTFGQHTADATHIQLLEGSIEKQAELVNVVGKLEVKVLEFR